MFTGTTFDEVHRTASGLLDRLIRADGVANHRFFAALNDPKSTARDLADLVHALCTVHGEHPGLIDAAFNASVAIDALPWLMDASAGFAVERTYLAQVTAAVGPLPSTHGQAESQAALIGQHQAFGLLGSSTRVGCAVGAVAAFMVDWTAMRRLLDRAADRCGIDRSAIQLPSREDTDAVIDRIGATPSAERAIIFGAQQVFAQHRGLWNLLETRAGARHAA